MTTQDAGTSGDTLEAGSRPRLADLPALWFALMLYLSWGYEVSECWWGPPHDLEPSSVYRGAYLDWSDGARCIGLLPQVPTRTAVAAMMSRGNTLFTSCN